MKRGLAYSLIVLILLLISFPCYASIIFQDNFDNCTTGCTVGSTEPNSPSTGSWLQWTLGGTTGTADGTTHYSGEITSPGRGGAGKSLKLWRYGSAYWTGSDSYAGCLVSNAPSTPYSNYYIRFYAKIPEAMDFPPDTKLFRFHTSGTSGEIYVNLNDYGSGLFLWVWGGTGDSSYNTELLTPAETATLLDGNWHCWQFQFNLASNTVTFWGDGVLMGSITDSRLDGAWNSYLNHFPLGNAQQGDWQSSWQSFEVDDLVIATTKAETDPDGGSDTTAPTVSISTSDPSSTTSDSFSVTGTASDAVGVTEVT